MPNTPLFRRPGNRTGTLQYMAPELIRRESTDERIDIFSCGVMAFEMLTDRIPYDMTDDQMALMRQRMNTDPIDSPRSSPTSTPDLQAIIRKSIARRPADRWKSMDEVVAALQKLPMAKREEY